MACLPQGASRGGLSSMVAAAITWGTPDCARAERSRGGRTVVVEPTDEELFGRFRRGERRALELLLARHRAPLYTFVLNLVGRGDAARAEDLVQETFIRVIKAAPGWEPRARFSTWLFTIARNLAFDSMRREAHRRNDSLDAPTPGPRPLRDTLSSSERGPEARAHDKTLRTALQRAVGRLPDEQREVFVLREVSGLAFKEIAEIQGVSENTVKSRMRYALSSLRTSLAEFELDEPSLRAGA